MRKVDKPWGHELVWAETERYVGKVLFIKAGHSLSRQYHRQKDETIFVESGSLTLELGPAGAVEPRNMLPGDAIRITPGTIHRMVALEDTRVFEASTTELDDVVRLEDAYGRQGSESP